MLSAEPSPVNGLTASFSEQTTLNSTTRVLTVDIDISWSLPAFQNGMVTFYEVTVFEEGTNTLVYSNNSITDLNVTESVMVLPFTDYTVSVSASTSAGQGDEATFSVESPQAGTLRTHTNSSYMYMLDILLNILHALHRA